MRRQFGKALRVGLSRDNVTLLQTGGWLRPRITVLSDQSFPQSGLVPHETLASRLNDVLAERKYKRLPTTIVLSDDLVRIFMVTPPQNVARLQDCKAAAEMRFRSLYGEAPVDWQIEADWHPRQSFLACALPRSLLAGLRKAAADQQLVLVEIVPHFIAAWNNWHTALSGSAWFAAADGNALTLGAIHQKKLCSVRSTSIPPEGWNDLQWLLTHAEREALRLNLPVPQQIQLCGHIDDTWALREIGPLRCSRLGVSMQKTSKVEQSVGFSLAYSGLQS